MTRLERRVWIGLMRGTKSTVRESHERTRAMLHYIHPSLTRGNNRTCRLQQRRENADARISCAFPNEKKGQHSHGELAREDTRSIPPFPIEALYNFLWREKCPSYSRSGGEWELLDTPHSMPRFGAISHEFMADASSLLFDIGARYWENRENITTRLCSYRSDNSDRCHSQSRGFVADARVNPIGRTDRSYSPARIAHRMSCRPDIRGV